MGIEIQPPEVPDHLLGTVYKIVKGSQIGIWTPKLGVEALTTTIDKLILLAKARFNIGEPEITSIRTTAQTVSDLLINGGAINLQGEVSPHQLAIIKKSGLLESAPIAQLNIVESLQRSGLYTVNLPPCQASELLVADLFGGKSAVKIVVFCDEATDQRITFTPGFNAKAVHLPDGFLHTTHFKDAIERYHAALLGHSNFVVSPKAIVDTVLLEFAGRNFISAQNN